MAPFLAYFSYPLKRIISPKELNPLKREAKSKMTEFIPLKVYIGWLVGFGFNGPLRQNFSLYRAVSQREGERGKKGQTRVKMSKPPPPAPTASAIGPCPTEIQIVGRPGTGSLPSTIAPPDRPPPPPLESVHFQL